ncbi:MAG: hypothetical protein K2H24_00905 [Clostridia bacterium]|nr:hypothetical protein [Clostridia bacterium]
MKKRPMSGCFDRGSVINISMSAIRKEHSDGIANDSGASHATCCSAERNIAV